MSKVSFIQEEMAQRNEKAVIGFWIYLMTDCVLFASLFATYAVLHKNTYGGPGSKDIFNLPYVLVETLILLTSSFSAGIATYSAYLYKKAQTVIFLIITIVLGLTFLIMELSEFSHLIRIGDSFRRSGFLSSYFALVGTHGIHIIFGLIALSVLVCQIMIKGLNRNVLRRINLISMFWHFLDVVWIFIFTIVYLMGVIK